MVAGIKVGLQKCFVLHCLDPSFRHLILLVGAVQVVPQVRNVLADLPLNMVSVACIART